MAHHTILAVWVRFYDLFGCSAYQENNMSLHKFF